MISALAQSFPQEGTRQWAFGFLLALSVGLFGLLTLLWIISRHRIHRYKRGKEAGHSGSGIDAWSEAGRRAEPDDTDEQEDRD